MSLEMTKAGCANDETFADEWPLPTVRTGVYVGAANGGFPPKVQMTNVS